MLEEPQQTPGPAQNKDLFQVGRNWWLKSSFVFICMYHLLYHLEISIWTFHSIVTNSSHAVSKVHGKIATACCLATCKWMLRMFDGDNQKQLGRIWAEYNNFESRITSARHGTVKSAALVNRKFPSSFQGKENFLTQIRLLIEPNMNRTNNNPCHWCLLAIDCFSWKVVSSSK